MGVREGILGRFIIGEFIFDLWLVYSYYVVVNELGYIKVVK